MVDDATAVATTKALLPIVSPATGNDGKHPLSPATTSQEQAAGRTWDGSATPAVQWGSVPRRLYFPALQ